MSEVSNGDIYNALMNMRGDLGRLEGKFDGHVQTLKAHIEDDAKLNEAVQKLQLAGARQKGFIAALAALGGVVGTGLGACVEYLSRGHS